MATTVAWCLTPSDLRDHRRAEVVAAGEGFAQGLDEHADLLWLHAAPRRRVLRAALPFAPDLDAGDAAAREGRRQIHDGSTVTASDATTVSISSSVTSGSNVSLAGLAPPGRDPGAQGGVDHRSH